MTTDDELRELIAKGEKATARPWAKYHAYNIINDREGLHASVAVKGWILWLTIE